MSNNIQPITTERAFGRGLYLCPDCGHGIDPHGVDPGGRCGVGDQNRVPCPCLMQPNGIVELLLAAQVAR